jgi:SOS-response transcriptional repressor LexA
MDQLSPTALKARLAEKGMKQADLARHLDLAPNKITKVFSGERRWTVQEADKIRALLYRPEEADRPPARTIPVIGQVSAGRWREAVQRPLYGMPVPDPSVPKNAFALQVQGDSMDLLVDDGGTVIVDPDDKALFPGRFYVIQTPDGESTFKQFKADPARLVPCSTNPAHQEVPIGGEPFEVVGRIIWRASRM